MIKSERRDLQKRDLQKIPFKNQKNFHIIIIIAIIIQQSMQSANIN